MVDSSICRREIVWVIGRIPYKLVPKVTVVQRIREQLKAVFPRKILSVWETNRASFLVIVRGIVQTPALVKEGIVDRLLPSEVEGVLWGDRRVYFMYMHVELMLMAEVALAAEVDRMIRNGILVEGKKFEVRAWIKEMKGKEEATASQKTTGGPTTSRASMGS